MKITLLVENQISYAAAKTCYAEWGLSLFVQVNGVNILFDTGHTDIFKHNAANLNIDLEKTDFVVLSHHHWDHVGGLRYHEFIDKKKLIIHPEIIEKLPDEDAERILNDFEITTSHETFEFAENCFYLGEIPRKSPFEKGLYKNDTMHDDSAIAIRTEKGVVVITGCSHSGIVNICEYAKKVTGLKLHAVIGGFHLFSEDEKAVKGTLDYFKKEQADHLYPMHCVDFEVLTRFKALFDITKAATGDVIQID
jgi:7,8-dihydropterin-6-yl-methyl-4-(beta-D-ribofuranosyl)aminobenzene 5'-phosphate synthase